MQAAKPFDFRKFHFGENHFVCKQRGKQRPLIDINARENQAIGRVIFGENLRELLKEKGVAVDDMDAVVDFFKDKDGFKELYEKYAFKKYGLRYLRVKMGEYVTGERAPKFNVFLDFCAALDCEFDDLMSEDLRHYFYLKEELAYFRQLAIEEAIEE